MFTKIVWLTDIHLLPQGEYLNGHDPAQRLDLALEHISKEHDDAAFCVVSGDLTDRGSPQCYQFLHQRFVDAGVSYLPLVGNHDDRDAFRKYLTLPSTVHETFVQYSVRLGDHRLICLDTLEQGKSEGYLCEERLQWLHNELSSDSDSPTVVFCHHPPKALHLPMLDPSRIRNGDELIEILKAYDCVKHLCFGHIHRPVSGAFGNLGFTAMRATSIQVPLPFPQWSWDNFEPVTEAPALGIVQLSAESCVIHAHAFCDAMAAVNPVNDQSA